ncbi:cytochrome P450 [Blastococcus sp. TML/M2B]|uniref:cytochrome P450 n=1 Tax=unclassified Blastococcus TaxID=2619396 RepID=UPI00190BDBE7|nr:MULTISPECIES: cytochrome P450 [unclassified Blastococcus]MBN1091787.1 cytochrome P450 [Blastococcus sp. TML/M2B]MBN1094654.1 cytochrome P450 [Blastococcus sp. TML/C7B]
MTTAMPRAATDLSPEQAEARERIYAAPLESLDPAKTDRFPTGEWQWVFERLRAEDPVHLTTEEHSEFGRYWSLTRWADIQAADTNHELFSADGLIALNRPEPVARTTSIFDGRELTEEEVQERQKAGIRSLLSMDPPDHEIHRGAVAEGVAPANLAALEPLIRERAGAILDGLPIGEEFDWVDKVSIELTAMTLATLFDYPQEKRRQLTYWSDVITTQAGPGQPAETQEEHDLAIRDFYMTMAELVGSRRSEEPRIDFMSLMAHSPHSVNFSEAELFGDSVVLLVGGNDTTRNTITGSVYFLSQNPEENAKLRANPKLIPSMVSETIRFQTPLTHMTRRTTRDVEIGGKVIPAGDRVVLWYVSGNRDDAKVQDADSYVVDRKNPRQHLSFGFGIHRCLGNKLAELQLRIIWEEMLVRFPEITVVGEPKRSHGHFVKGYDSMTVVIPRRN